MPLANGANTVTARYVGANVVSKVYNGANLVVDYSAAPGIDVLGQETLGNTSVASNVLTWNSITIPAGTVQALVFVVSNATNAGNNTLPGVASFTAGSDIAPILAGLTNNVSAGSGNRQDIYLLDCVPTDPELVVTGVNSNNGGHATIVYFGTVHSAANFIMQEYIGPSTSLIIGTNTRLIGTPLVAGFSGTHCFSQQNVSRGLNVTSPNAQGTDWSIQGIEAYSTGRGNSTNMMGMGAVSTSVTDLSPGIQFTGNTTTNAVHSGMFAGWTP